MKTRTELPHKLLVVHGPNLNLLGERDPEVYGTLTLESLNTAIQAHAETRRAVCRFAQSNHEGVLIDTLHENRHWARGIIINPGALTHYSYALRDAVDAVRIPAVEVHLSDIQHREPFRRISVIAPVCIAQIYGMGRDGYFQAVDRLVAQLEKSG